MVEFGGRDMVKRGMRSATLLNQQLGLREATVSFAEGASGFAAVDFDISICDQSLLGRNYGEVLQQLTAHSITATVDMPETVEAVKVQHKIVLPMPDFNSEDGQREHAYYTTERSQLTKLSAKDADVLDDLVVILLTETKIRGRSGVYAEYVFALPDGERRRLSAKDKMTVRVKQLVEEYECWHLEAVGAFSYDWIQQQDDYPGSDADDEAAMDGSKGYKEDVLREGLDEESEPEDMEEMQTCQYFAENELEQRGLSNFSKARHIDAWDDSVLRAYAKTRMLPTVHSSISDLSGKPLLVYTTVVDSKERLTMRDDERMASWFAVGAKVIGEGRSSTEMSCAGHDSDCVV